VTVALNFVSERTVDPSPLNKREIVNNALQHMSFCISDVINVMVLYETLQFSSHKRLKLLIFIMCIQVMLTAVQFRIFCIPISCLKNIKIKLYKTVILYL
jgi:hypothetical protein